MAYPTPPPTPLSFLTSALAHLQRRVRDAALSLLQDATPAVEAGARSGAPPVAHFEEAGRRLVRNVLRRQKSEAGTSGPWQEFVADVTDFYRAVDWSQSWITWLLGFHLGTFVTLFLVRKHQTWLATMLCCLLILAGMAEPLNSIAAARWRSFASANYFDASGTFAAAVFAGPLLFNAAVCTLYLLALLVSRVAQAKRAEITSRRRIRPESGTEGVANAGVKLKTG